MNDQAQNFAERYETDNFVIKVDKPRFGDKETDIEARVHVKYKDNDIPAYSDDTKLSPRSLTSFCKAACKAQDIDFEEYGKEIDSQLLQKKSEIKEMTKERIKWMKENQDRDSKDETQAKVNEVVKRIYQAEGEITIKDFADIKHFSELREANDDLILIKNGDNLILTDKGKKKAENLLGITEIENPEEKAEEILEEGFLEYFLDAINEVHKGDQELKIWELVSALSAKCSNRQINSWAVGPSGKGKSHIKRAIIKFLPEEAYEAPNSMSPKAMLYKTKNEGFDVFKGKLLFLDEAEGYDDNDALVLLRGLTDPDEDKFVHEMVEDQEHKELIIEKPIAVWFTSVESIADEQLKNRFILTNPDGSDELDEKVFKHQMQNLHKGEELGTVPAEAAVIKHAIKKIRQNAAGLTPIVPFEVEWKQKFNRRLYPYFVTLMEIIAKINYKNRLIKENYIYVTRSDFRTASLIWSSLIDTTIAQTDVEALKLIMELPEKKQEAYRTSELARSLEGFNVDKVRRKAELLRDTEELQLINAQKDGNQWEYWAGNDRDLLVNPEPEIVSDPETVKEILEKTNKGISEDILTAMNDAEVPVYQRLKKRKQKIKEKKMAEVNEWTVDLEDKEKKLLRFLQDTNFSASLDFVVSSFEQNANETWDMLDKLEDKGMIKIKEEEGDKYARKTQSFKSMKSEGKLTL